MNSFPHYFRVLPQSRQVLSGCIAIWLCASPSLAWSQQRRYEKWDFQARGGIAPSDSFLLNPVRLAVDDSAIYLYDAGTYQVKAYSWSGTSLWSLGRLGSGPLEFRNVLALRVAPEGTIWVYDHGNSRLTVLNPNGSLRTSHLMSNPILPGGLTPLSRGRFLAQAFVKSPFPILFDSTGGVSRRFRMPPELAGRDMIQTRLVGGSSTTAWTVWSSFRTDRIYFINPDLDSIIAIRGVTPLDFPKTQVATIRTPDGKTVSGVRPDADNVTAGVAIAAIGDTAFVLMGSAADYPLRTLDVYSVTGAKYLSSIKLPEMCNAFTIHRLSLVCLQFDPTPQVKVWSMSRPYPLGRPK